MLFNRLSLKKQGQFFCKHMMLCNFWKLISKWFEQHKFCSPPFCCDGRGNLRDSYLKTRTNKTKTEQSSDVVESIRRNAFDLHVFQFSLCMMQPAKVQLETNVEIKVSIHFFIVVGCNLSFSLSFSFSLSTFCDAPCIFFFKTSILWTVGWKTSTDFRHFSGFHCNNVFAAPRVRKLFLYYHSGLTSRS